jgi:hypothetical protein
MWPLLLQSLMGMQQEEVEEGEERGAEHLSAPGVFLSLRRQLRCQAEGKNCLVTILKHDFSFSSLCTNCSPSFLAHSLLFCIGCDFWAFVSRLLYEANTYLGAVYTISFPIPLTICIKIYVLSATHT